jgi:DNA topoisomerase I
MAKNLVIVESPAKSKTINKILGKTYKVKASMGHVIDLPKSKIGIDLEHNFEPQYITIKGKNKILKELKDSAKGVDNIFLAPDPDREGEAIAWHIGNYLAKSSKANIYRVTFNEITKKAVSEAVKNPGKIDMDRVNAQQARRILDRIVGYKVSPFLWKGLGRGLSAGRVQSVAVRLILDREEEIRNFEIEEYWTIEALLAKYKEEKDFIANLEKKDNKKLKIKNKEESDIIVKDLDGVKYIVKSVIKKERKKNPFPPFKTSLLQQQASYKLYFSASKTMQIAQQLYEGISLDGDNTGLITYMRTDSFRIANEAQVEAREFVSKKFGEEFVPEKPRFYKSKKTLSQDAHEAIRPTSVNRTPADMKKHLTADQYKLYKLIWNRFVASQMSSAILDMTSVEIAADNYLFKATGSVVRFQGYLIVENDLSDAKSKKTKKDDEEEESKKQDVLKNILPDLIEGEELNLKELKPEQHFTKPPARYSEATLVKALEQNGIGRPSTYAPIIRTIQARNYVEMKERRFHPTALGETVVKLLMKFFSNIVEIDFTAGMELVLDEIEAGKKDWVKVIRDFYKPFSKNLIHAETKIDEIRKENMETDEVCEECGAPMYLRNSKYGRFLACSKYPECKFTKDSEEDIEATKKLEELAKDEVCEKCGSKMLIKKGRFGAFLACEGYPECKTTRSVDILRHIKCPEPDCDGELVGRRSKKTRRMFYGCTKYPDCKYITNKLPENSDKEEATDKD